MAQDRVYVEHHALENGNHKVWTMREYTNLKDVVNLETIPVKLRLPDIYAKVSFPVEST